jgi:predicted nucleic acid-binding protein
MRNIYLDSNIYIFGILTPKSNSGIVLDSASDEDLHIVQSDYLIDEILHWFRRNRGKSDAGKARVMLSSIPNRTVISRHEWELSVDKWHEKITDPDDVPHICSYFVGDCEAFVTTNRKLTQMAISEYVRFYSPYDFLKHFLNVNPSSLSIDI